MTVSIEMHLSVHLHSFTCAVSLEGMPAFHKLCASRSCPTAWHRGEWNLSKALQLYRQRFLVAQTPRGLCSQRCSVKSSVTCWSPPETVRMLRCISCVSPRQELSAGPALLSPQSKKFSAEKGLFTQAELMTKFASPEGEGWEKWVLLSWVKKILFSSKLWSSHQSGSLTEDVHTACKDFFSQFNVESMRTWNSKLSWVLAWNLNVPTVTTWVILILFRTQQNNLISLPVFFGKMTFSYNILPKLFFFLLLFWVARGRTASLFAVPTKTPPTTTKPKTTQNKQQKTHKKPKTKQKKLEGGKKTVLINSLSGA